MQGKNFLGGFLGGTLGTLMFALFGPIWMLVGCVVGVIAGYYRHELGQILREASQAAQAAEPVQRHWMHNAWVSKLLSGIVYWAILLTMTVFVFKGITSTEVSAWGAFALSGVVIGIMYIGISVSSVRDLRLRSGPLVRKNIRRFVRESKVYRKYGVVGLALHDLGQRFKESYLAGAMCTAMMCMVASLAIASLVVPMSAIVCAVKAVYHLMRQRDHYRCLAVSIATTVLMVSAYGHLLHGPMVLALALLTGLIAGAAAEAVAHRLPTIATVRGLEVGLGQLLKRWTAWCFKPVRESSDLMVRATDRLFAC